jgi:hypothetical protein
MIQRQRYPALGTKTGQAFKRNAPKQRTNKKNKAITRQDAIDIIPIEGKFGQSIRRFGLGLVMTKLSLTVSASLQ